MTKSSGTIGPRIVCPRRRMADIDCAVTFILKHARATQRRMRNEGMAGFGRKSIAIGSQSSLPRERREIYDARIQTPIDGYFDRYSLYYFAFIDPLKDSMLLATCSFTSTRRSCKSLWGNVLFGAEGSVWIPCWFQLHWNWRGGFMEIK